MPFIRHSLDHYSGHGKIKVSAERPAEAPICQSILHEPLEAGVKENDHLRVRRSRLLRLPILDWKISGMAEAAGKVTPMARTRLGHSPICVRTATLAVRFVSP